jgi:hypothetical protein
MSDKTPPQPTEKDFEKAVAIVADLLPSSCKKSDFASERRERMAKRIAIALSQERAEEKAGMVERCAKFAEHFGRLFGCRCGREIATEIREGAAERKLFRAKYPEEKK